MTENIKTLLALFEHGRTNIKKLDYENQEHLEFVNSLVTALKNAAPEIRSLSLINDRLNYIEDVTCGIHRLLATRGIEVTIPIPDAVREASNGASPEPQTECNNRSPDQTQNTAGIASAPGQTAGTSGKPASAGATLNDARKAAALSKEPLPPASAPSQKPKRGGAPRRVQSSIV